jgi:cation transport regulator
MRYDTIEDLPTVWRLNLPEAAQHIYKDAFNRAWAERRDERAARMVAWGAVRQRFQKDSMTGRWVARPHAQTPAASPHPAHRSS